MTKIFPKPITKLPKADIHIDGLEAYLAQEKNNQILFMKFWIIDSSSSIK